jgi:hypothetical protein
MDVWVEFLAVSASGILALGASRLVLGSVLRLTFGPVRGRPAEAQLRRGMGV